MLSEALSLSQYAELRLDFFKPSDVIPYAESVSGYMDRCICTVRPAREGGRFAGPEDSRVRLLEQVSAFRPYLLDVELSTLEENPQLRGLDGMMVSWHDFEASPTEPALRQRLQRMSGHSDWVKMVVTATRGEDAAAILGLYAVRNSTTLVAFAMGESGRFSRICAMHMGCPFMYVSLGLPVAPGQYSIHDIARITESGVV